MSRAAALHSAPKMTEKEAAFIREHWPPEGRAERVARAEKAWKDATKHVANLKKLDPDTIKWIAEDPDLEYLQ